MTAANFILDIGFVDSRCGATTTSLSFANLDSSADECGALFQAGTTNAITHLGFKVATKVGTPPTYKIALEGDSSGLPDGTIKGGGSPASATFDPSGWADDSVNWIALDNSYTPSSPDELLWIVVSYDSGTINSSNRLLIWHATNSNNLFFDDDGLGFAATTANNWSSASKLSSSLFGVRTASERFGYLTTNANVIADTQNITTNGHRKVAKYTPPITFTVDAISVMCDPDSAGNNIIGIWNSSGTLLQGETFSTNSTTNTTDGRYTVRLPATQELTAGTAYYIGIERVTGSFGLEVCDLAEADDRLMGMAGTAVSLSEWNGSTWTDTTTKVPYNIGLHVVDVASGGGGSVIVIEDD